jgi:hypothetical protein
MTPERGALALLHIQLLWEVMQEGNRRETALAYVNSAGFQDLCDLLGMSEVPAKIRETAEKRPAQLFALFHNLHRKNKS